MIKTTLFISAFLTSALSLGQIDYSKLIIGRTTGTHLLHDGNQTRIFGFAETLSESVELPGPIIEMNEGDSVEIDFWNVSQGAPHTIHLHGLDVDQQNDGVPELSFEVHHMDHGYYRFKAPHAGTYLYHCHVVSPIHVQAGMYGAIIVRPSNGDTHITWENGETYGRDFVWTSSEIDTNWHTNQVLEHPYDTVNPMPVMLPPLFSPQYFVVSGRSGTQLTDPANYYVAEQNEKVYLRLTNIGYYGVRYIFPSSVNSRIISSDGRPLPFQEISDTLEILPGERYGVMVELGTDALYPVSAEHFNLNNGVVESTQDVTIKTSTASLNDTESGLIVYPNPSTGVFYLSKATNFSVTDQFGKVVLKEESNKVDISDYPDGMYYLQSNDRVEKLVKISL